jgi:hypothetical protein
VVPCKPVGKAMAHARSGFERIVGRALLQRADAWVWECATGLHIDISPFLSDVGTKPFVPGVIDDGRQKMRYVRRGSQTGTSWKPQHSRIGVLRGCSLDALPAVEIDLYEVGEPPTCYQSPVASRAINSVDAVKYIDKFRQEGCVNVLEEVGVAWDT